MMVNSFDTLQEQHYIMQKIGKKLQSFLEINITGKKYISHQGKIFGKSLRKNNSTIVFNELYFKKLSIYSAYISDHNLNHENQTNLSIIPNGER